MSSKKNTRLLTIFTTEKRRFFFISGISKSKQLAFNLKYMFCYTEKKPFLCGKEKTQITAFNLHFISYNCSKFSNI